METIQEVMLINPTGGRVLLEPKTASAITSLPAKFTGPTRIYVGVTGNLEVMLWGDYDYVTFKNVQGGAIFVGQVKEIGAGTTATDLVIVG